MKAKKVLSAVLSAAMVLGSAVLPANAEDDVWITSGISRDADNIGTNRGLVAVKTSDGVFLSWRLFESEDSVFGTADNGVKFNVYKNGSLIKENLNNTNYTDTSGKTGDIYKVEPVGGGVSGEAATQANQYFDIPLQKPANQTVEDGSTVSYAPNDVSTGDIDGDGELELVLKWDANGQDNSNSGITGNVIIDAYKQDGTLLWRVDLGRNIRAGAHYTQFLVYDFDGDGKAEMTCKTAPGSKDSAGNYVSKASLDSTISGISDEVNQTSYVDDGGRVPDGAEYYTLFESDGTAADTIYYPYDRDCGIWGYDSSGKVDKWNRIDRFLGTVAYLDGVHPAAITLRGYYDKTTVAAYTVENGRLKLQASFNANAGAQFSGQGNHNITVADVDNDGKDEVLTGAICWDDDLSVLWCSGRGHGDALHIGDYDPTHSGYEYFSVHESGGYTIGDSSTTASKGQTADYGMTVYDAATGEELLHSGNSKDTGRGVMANIGSGGYYQISGSANMQSNGGTDFTSTNAGPGSNFRIFWDGDLYDEILDGVNISDYQNGSVQGIFSADGCVSLNGTKANPGLQADLFGDWREEVVYPTSDGNYLRVYTTTISTDYKMKSLMTDSVYRSGIAAEQTAYNQPPHIGYYLDGDIIRAIKKITLTPPEKTTYKYGENLDTTGMEVIAEYEDGSTEETNSYTVSGYNKNLVGTQTVTVTVGNLKATFTVEVTTDFVIENGEVTGYNGAGGAETIPEVYNGKPVTAVASGALAGSGITELTVPDSVKDIAAGAIDASVLIKCTEGSAAHRYALENGNPFELTKDILESYAYADFDTEEYANINDMVFSTTEQNQKVGNILYHVGNRNRNGQAGEENTGIRFVTEESGNKYAAVTAGRFADSGRNAYIHLGGVEGVKQEENDFVLSMKLRFEEPVNGGKVQIALSNQNISQTDTSLISDCVDVIEPGERGLDYGKWYSYSLISRNGKYYRVIQDLETEGAAASIEVIGDSDGTLPFYIGAYKYGESGNGIYGTVDIDNLMAYSCESAFANLTVYLQYADDTPVANHVVTVNGTEYMTDESGKAILSDIMPGLYEISATVDGQLLSDSVYASGDSYAWLTVIIYYNITLQTNGGIINSGDITSYIYSIGATLPTDITRDNYIFNGWYENSDFSGNAVTAVSKTDMGDKTYYAKWTGETYTVTLDANGGTVNDGDVTSYEYGIGAMLPTDVTRDNYYFCGWYDNAEFTGEAITVIPATDTGDKEYWAKWTEAEPTEYLITFVNYDNSILQSGNVEIGTTPIYEGETPAKPDDGMYSYTFIGWNPEVTAVNGIATYTAQYSKTPIVYSVKWQADGSVIAAAPATGEHFLIFAAYKDGVLIDIQIADAVFDAASEITVPVHDGFDMSDADTVKAMLWNSIIDMQPLCGSAIKKDR